MMLHSASQFPTLAQSHATTPASLLLLLSSRKMQDDADFVYVQSQQEHSNLQQKSSYLDVLLRRKAVPSLSSTSADNDFLLTSSCSTPSPVMISRSVSSEYEFIEKEDEMEEKQEQEKEEENKQTELEPSSENIEEEYYDEWLYSGWCCPVCYSEIWHEWLGWIYYEAEYVSLYGTEYDRDFQVISKKNSSFLKHTDLKNIKHYKQRFHNRLFNHKHSRWYSEMRKENKWPTNELEWYTPKTGSLERLHSKMSHPENGGPHTSYGYSRVQYEMDSARVMQEMREKKTGREENGEFDLYERHKPDDPSYIKPSFSLYGWYEEQEEYRKQLEREEEIKQVHERLDRNIAVSRTSLQRAPHRLDAETRPALANAKTEKHRAVLKKRAKRREEIMRQQAERQQASIPKWKKKCSVKTLASATKVASQPLRDTLTSDIYKGNALSNPSLSLFTTKPHSRSSPLIPRTIQQNVLPSLPRKQPSKYWNWCRSWNWDRLTEEIPLKHQIRLTPASSPTASTATIFSTYDEFRYRFYQTYVKRMRHTLSHVSCDTQSSGCKSRCELQSIRTVPLLDKSACIPFMQRFQTLQRSSQVQSDLDVRVVYYGGDMNEVAGFATNGFSLPKKEVVDSRDAPLDPVSKKKTSRWVKPPPSINCQWDMRHAISRSFGKKSNIILVCAVVVAEMQPTELISNLHEITFHTPSSLSRLVPLYYMKLTQEHDPTSLYRPSLNKMEQGPSLPYRMLRRTLVTQRTRERQAMQRTGDRPTWSEVTTVQRVEYAQMRKER